MEQYRRMENNTSGSPFKKNVKSSIGALFVRKMRRASSELISRVPRSRSRNRVGDGLSPGDRDSPDQHDGILVDTFSLGSGSQSGSNSRCGSLDGGSGGEGDVTTPTSLTGSVSGNLPANSLHSGSSSGQSWSERDRIRQSMPIIHYQHPDSEINTSPLSNSSVRHSISSDAVCNGTTTMSVALTNNQLNGNASPVTPVLFPQQPTNGNSATIGTDPDGIPVVMVAGNPVATNTNSPRPSLSGGLVSVAPLMMMSPSNTPIQQKQLQSPRINGVARFGSHNTPDNNCSPIPAGVLNRFPQSSRSLALLERAGSRQPLCISEVDPALVLNETSGLALPMSLRSSPLLTPRNISPVDNNESVVNSSTSSGSTTSNNNNIIINNRNNQNSSLIRSGAAAALVQTSSTSQSNPNTTSPAGPADGINSANAKLFPHLTSTTRINVNISTAAITPLTPSPSSPLLPGPLERRGSLRLPPRPSPRISSIDTPPILPARASSQDRPALPPRSYPNSSAPAVEEKPVGDDIVNGGAPGTAAGASSIWYEYGCV